MRLPGRWRLGGSPVVALLTVVAAALLLVPARAEPGDTERVSVSSGGEQGDTLSEAPSVSDDGRYVAFESDARNLVVGDTNDKTDIFLRDRETGVTTRVSVDTNDAQMDGTSNDPSISGDGRFVTFRSFAFDTNGFTDILVRDRLGSTTRVSVDSLGVEGNGNSLNPSISDDGRHVAFQSFASDMVAGDTNGFSDIYVRDRLAAEATRVSVDSLGSEANDFSARPSISSDGRYVAFQSRASNLVAGDTNGFTDIFVHDRQSGETTRLTMGSLGGEANENSFGPSMSNDGRYVAFTSAASNLVAGDANDATDIFVHDRQTAVTTRVSLDSLGSEANDDSNDVSISGNGRHVAFESEASDLVTGDANGTLDAFHHDRLTGVTTRVSVDSLGGEASGFSSNPSISGTGRHVAFESWASSLVAGDTNNAEDVFLHELPASPTPTGTPPVGESAVWGDHNCSGPPPNPIDSLLTLRHDAGLSTNTGDCPDFGESVSALVAAVFTWGDVDCSGSVNPIDSLKLLRFDAGLGVTQGSGCPLIGAPI